MVNRNNDVCTLLRIPSDEELNSQAVSPKDLKNTIDIHLSNNYKDMILRAESGMIIHQTNPKLLPKYMLPRNASEIVHHFRSDFGLMVDGMEPPNRFIFRDPVQRS